MSEKDAPGGNTFDLFIEAGPILLRWSHADEGKGWVYYDPSVLRVYIASATDYEDQEDAAPFGGTMTVKKLDLKRFLRR